MNHIARLNRSLHDLPEEHPATKFLNAFVECRQRCVGKEIGWQGAAGIDQAWQSDDGCRWRFSSFAYEYLAFDIQLDGWIDKSSCATQSELAALASFRKMHHLMNECAAAAGRDGNVAVLEMVEVVRETLDLWESCILARLNALPSLDSPS